MKSKSISLLAIFSLLLGTVIISETVQTASGVGVVSADIKPGNNYWFDVTSFPSLQELIDLSGANENSSVQLSATGGLQASRIYAKVMAVNDETLTYFDGTNNITSNSVPTVDFALGLITGTTATLEAKNTTDNTIVSTTVLPAGVGFPVPAVFGFSTYLNIVNFQQRSLIPIPLVLNDDWTVHSAVANELATMVSNEGIGSITITDDTAQFKLDFDVLVNENDSTAFKGSASWSKSDGLVSQLVFTPYNDTTGANIFTTIDITLNRAKTENKMVAVEVGDTFTIKVDAAGFDFTTVGFQAEDDPAASLTEIQNAMGEYVGETLLDLEVKEVNGMYYRVEGSSFNGTGVPRVQIPDPNSDGEAWMVGFGRLGPGMIMNAFFSSGDNNGSNSGPGAMLDSLRLNILSHDDIRTYLVPGFVVSEDWEIYAAWDKTIEFFVEAGLTSFLAALQELQEDENHQIYSSVSSDPVFTATYNGGEELDGSYLTDLSASADVIVMNNDTEPLYDSNGFYLRDTWFKTTIEVKGNVNYQIATAKHGSFDFMELSGGVDVVMTGQDENGTYGPSTISVSNFKVNFNGNMTRVHPIIDPVPISNATSSENTTTGDGGTSGPTPGFDLPGFELPIAFVSFIAIIVIHRKRK